MNCFNSTTNNTCVAADKIYCDIFKYSVAIKFQHECQYVVTSYTGDKRSFHFYIDGLGNCFDPKKSFNEYELYKDNIKMGYRVPDDYFIRSKKNNDGNVCVG